jgi:hypothetical protein
MTPLETLKAARQLITDPAKWTQGWFARNAAGENVNALSQSAVCFCALGALDKFNAVPATIDAITRQLPSDLVTISKFNDTHTHAEVLALFDAAIAELEGEAP